MRFTRTLGFTLMFVSLSIVTSTVLGVFHNWSFFMKNGIWSTFPLLFLFLLTVAFLYATLFGFSLFEMTIDSEKKQTKYFLWMVGQGYTKWSEIIVYGPDNEQALAGESPLRYTYLGETYKFTPKEANFDDANPTRFLPVHHRKQNSVLVYDCLKREWYIFHK